eukprot:Phypoly_transcript_01180.p1 GENE.Phypoly_transcript_01180~~Phypoly_transcript_01180.p1  ORF type:complete len:1168 (+),score=212.99 Phypoly_transcript_01180:101-3505(+)
MNIAQPIVTGTSSAIRQTLKDLSSKEKDDTWHSYLEKIPAWAGKALLGTEYDVGVTFTKADEEFGNKLAKDLQDQGLKCTTDTAQMSNARAFVLIYSEDAATDETVLRLLTRAAERFNDGNTTIFPVVHPKCATTVLDQIPPTLAYSLSNTTFVNMIPSPSLAKNAEFVKTYYQKKLGALKTRLEGYVRQKPQWDVSGVWLLRVVLRVPGSTAYELQEFTAFLQHKDATNIVGSTVNGVQIEGTLAGNSLKLELHYEGPWTQSNEQWQNEEFVYIAQINAGLKVQGTKLEGSYVDSFGGVHRSGTVSAILEEECLSGYYDFSVDDKDDQKISLIQRGDRVFGDVSGMHGVLFSGVITKDQAFWAYSVGDKSGSYNGIVEDEFDSVTKKSTIKGFAYLKDGTEFKLQSFTATQIDPALEMPPNFAAFFGGGGAGGGGNIFANMFGGMSGMMGVMMGGMDMSNMGNMMAGMGSMMSNMMESMQSFGFEMYDKQKELEEAYAKKFNIDITPYTPLLDDEFGVLIGSAEDCAEQAKALQENLTNLGIPRVTLDIANYPKARTFIILLSAGTKNDPALVEATFKTAVSNKPIFNIGLSDFFAIFDETKWTDKEALRNLRDALARLNQTDASTLDPTNINFNALVRRIKGYVEAPNYHTDGLWYLRFPDTPKQDFTIFLTQSGNIVEGTEFTGVKWKGMVQNDEFVLKKVGADGQYVASISSRLKEKGSAFIGRYKTEDGKAYNTLGTRETDGISGLWEVEKQSFKLGIVQRGGGRLLIQHGGTLYPGVMSGNFAIFQIPPNEGSTEKATFEAVVRNSKNGLVMSGHFYTEKSETGPFIAKQVVVEKKEEVTTYDVMISYRSTDSKFIDLLQKVLETNGISCWRDRRMEVGTNWSEDITRAVRSSRCVIGCLSDNYVKSSLCTKEILMAHDMGKFIVPLVLPDSEKKESEYQKMVRAAYPSAHPPHVVAREIAKTTWFDFRPFSNGPDPADDSQFESRYPLVTDLKRLLHNIKYKGCLWDLDGTWQFNFQQDKESNIVSLATFTAQITFDHTKFSLNGTGVVTGEGIAETQVTIDSVRLENSVLSFAAKFPASGTQGVMFVKVMIGIDGKSLAGKFTALKVGNWCNPSGVVVGKLIAEKQ